MSQLDLFGGRRVVHGTPITPNHLLESLAGGSFCVSFAAPDQLNRCVDLVGDEEMLLLDNAAFSIWRAKLEERQLPARLQFASQREYREAFWAWANPIQARCPQAIAVIPDVIEGGERANLEELSWALREGLAEFPERAMGIWHLDESFDFLTIQCRLLNFVGMGSTTACDVQKHKQAYLARMRQVYTVIAAAEAVHGAERPWIHLMRGNGIFKHVAWADSADSTNVAVNSHRLRETHGARRAAERARRIEGPIQQAAAQIPLRSATL